jgi:hypothetical protein
LSARSAEQRSKLAATAWGPGKHTGWSIVAAAIGEYLAQTKRVGATDNQLKFEELKIFKSIG